MCEQTLESVSSLSGGVAGIVTLTSHFLRVGLGISSERGHGGLSFYLVLCLKNGCVIHFSLTINIHSLCKSWRI